MATISLVNTVPGTTGIDETAGNQTDLNKKDIDLAGLPSAVVTAFNTALGGTAWQSDPDLEVAGNADNDLTVSGTGTINGLSFLDVNGGTLNGDASGLFTLEGKQIFLYTSATDDNVVLGREGSSATTASASGDVVFAIYLQETTTAGVITGGTFWTVLFETLDHPITTNPDDFVDMGGNLRAGVSETVQFDFNGAPAGNNLFMMFGQGTTGLVVTGESPDDTSTNKLNDGDTVNSSQGGVIGDNSDVTTLGSNGQQLKANTSLIFTYVNNPAAAFTVPGLSSTEAKAEGNIQFGSYKGTTAASFTVSQVTPTGSSFTVELTAYNNTGTTEQGTSYVEGILDADDQPVTINSVTITSIDGTVTVLDVLPATADGDGLDPRVTLSGQTVIISGITDDDEVAWTTATPHNRVQIENGEPDNSNVSFDIGFFEIADATTTSIPVGPALPFYDDGPGITVNNATGTFAAGAQGTWDHSPGTDTFKSLSLTLNSYAIDDGNAGTNDTVTVNTSLGTRTTTDANGNYVFTGSLTADFTPTDGIANAQTINFTLTFDPDNPETYDFDLTTPPGTVILRDTSQGQLKAGGPDPVQTLLFGGSETGADDVVFFGAVATAAKENGTGTAPNDLEDLVVSGSGDLTEDQIQAFLSPTNQIPTLINSGTQMNVSTSGIGINNNNLDGNGTAGIQATDESFVFNPEETVDRVRVYIDNSVGGYTPGTGEQLYYTVYYTDGTVSADNPVTAAMLENALRTDPTVPQSARGGKFFEIDDDKEIDAVQLTMGNGTVKIPVIQWAIEQEFNPAPLQLNLTAALVDDDDDSTPDTFSINLTDDLIV